MLILPIDRCRCGVVRHQYMDYVASSPKARNKSTYSFGEYHSVSIIYCGEHPLCGCASFLCAQQCIDHRYLVSMLVVCVLDS